METERIELHMTTTTCVHLCLCLCVCVARAPSELQLTVFDKCLDVCQSKRMATDLKQAK